MGTKQLLSVSGLISMHVQH